VLGKLRWVVVRVWAVVAGGTSSAALFLAGIWDGAMDDDDSDSRDSLRRSAPCLSSLPRPSSSTAARPWRGDIGCRYQ
jgi:hypothetical protein